MIMLYSTQGESKFLQYFGNISHTSTAPNGFTNVMKVSTHTHTHTHTHIYIYIYIDRERKRERETKRERARVV